MSGSHEELDHLSREDLIARARVLGVDRAQLMTRVELRDEIIRRSETDAVRRQRSRGWLGVARDLVASVVEQGLNMQGAAALIRGEGQRTTDEVQGPPPVATVTLAEIYAAQGHFERALNMLEEVLQREPDHEVARALRQRLRAERESAPDRARKRRAPEPAAPVAAAEAVAEAAAWDAAPAPSEPTAAREAPLVSEAEVQIPEAPPVAADRPARAPEPAAEASAPEPEAPALVLLRDGDRAYVYWEVPSRWLKLQENGAQRPALVARTVGFVPREAAPEQSVRDFEPTERVGGAWISKLQKGEVLRAALGYRQGAEFSAVAVASELSLLPSGPKREFCPLGFEPSDFVALEARASAHLQAFRG
jgi:Tetratricopeptide repeat